MILLDTNVLIYASTDQSPFLEWAWRTIAAGVSVTLLTPTPREG